MKNNYKRIIPIKNNLKGIFRKKGITAFLFLAFSMNVMAQSAQKVSLKVKNVPASAAIDALKKQVKGFVVYNHEEVNALPKVTLNVKDQPFEKVLDQILAGSNLNYTVQNNSIIIGPKSDAKTSVARKKILVTGVVSDEDNLPLFKASVSEYGTTNNGTTTNEKGQFQLNVAENSTIIISYLGMTPQRISVGEGKTSFKITLKSNTASIKEVVVTGIPYTRRAESFTGAATKITKQELQRAGTQNIFQSLKNLEPSLNISDNFVNGSDPNKLPDMQVRGSSSFPDLKGEYATKPNQPLFIVDGFEMTIEKVSDLPLTRIESVTILKDASAKAIYGSRAANGVIVIETVKVKPGQLRLNYNGSLGIEAPDFSSYNMANASEKLNLEKQLGAYNRAQPITSLPYDSLYYANLKEVQSGVNTDWLAQPTQMGVTNKHAFSLEAGDERLSTGFSFFTSNTQGVMKGSDRKNLGGAFSLSYRYNGVMFRNQFQLSKVNSANSPYGNFDEYAKLNPYWRPYNEDGTVRRFLGIGPILSGSVYNPMYNATINTTNTSDYTDITNNTYLEWKANDNIKVTGRFGFTNTVNGSEVFYPASHTKYMGSTTDDITLRGSYDKGNGKASSVSSDLNMNYSKEWGRHSLFTNIGTTIREDKSENYLYSAVGLPNDKLDNIIFAKQYAVNSKPTGSESIARELGTLATANYSFDNKYFADASIRYSTSSLYGSNNRWGAFWSAGAGWNIHKESFLADNKYINLLKLRGSMGYTGSQNFSAYQAMLLYTYNVDNPYQGLFGTNLLGLPNNDLKWQQRLDYNVGLDAEILKRLSMRLDVYKGITNNLITDITTPPSLGFNTYKANLGQIVNTGLEFKLNYKMLVNPTNRQMLNVFVAGASNTNKIEKISNSLQSLTSSQDKLSATSNKLFTRFQEGQSLDAIWAVPSNGIDPATGKEIFVKKDGTLTDVWDVNDKVVVGNSQPKLQGNIGANFQYKGFSAGIIGRYRMGGQLYNQTLVDKVENASLNNNVDKRAYYNSWKNPGDDVLFRNIGVANTITQPTSRFVQNLSELNLSSINLGYDFYKFEFVKKLKLESLSLMLNLNDVQTFSTVQTERGTAYPFARYCSFTVNANF
ncbi:SusC/RagA family TonB-linked outer membrane protein [Solitalea koreensis]|uniref:TonB-linked outer membrane protein, SusC/RagA family n=1 Tax=Solitalea koreensis TaxID=543615 RepID=A0A521AAU6_9SPHI|nr:SusC/RagA family TonB-linked outer membrane protein [Solitalea koreensis]SMO31851.1 TonB-linked outer membrane protein, SusC/RagA family [Solitalea koreensis]